MEIRLYNEIERGYLGAYLWMYVPKGGIKMGKLLYQVGEPEVLKVIPVNLRNGDYALYDYDKLIEGSKTLTPKDATEQAFHSIKNDGVFDEFKEVDVEEEFTAYIRHYDNDDFEVDRIVIKKPYDRYRYRNRYREVPTHIEEPNIPTPWSHYDIDYPNMDFKKLSPYDEELFTIIKKVEWKDDQ